MRATRFRLGAGCLSWEKKDGTAARNQSILDIIPAQYEDRAVKRWCDPNKAEINRIQKRRHEEATARSQSTASELPRRTKKLDFWSNGDVETNDRRLGHHFEA